ncbi:DUF1330 domain-containing protein [Pseudomonas syringae]|uniref:DUF1330 domain-containing protein n=1 Tax=Pseudomonas syringae pv. daphniphylli TaxID=264455 RepID=A0A9X0KV70_PSESX|nr:DUF1330 domain-containing protein [Pseudomonas syringae]KPX09275.1 Uncharacterized protein ALO73_00825 [Pseudomonas syringae pv. daphniphylli]KWS85723.1 hypothetical protein AL050_26810 [Pseudomonas syringae pv. daphniphylli]
MSKPTYFILEINIRDAEGMKPYLDNVGATIAPFAFDFLANGGEIVPLEGQPPIGKIVVLRFESMEAAQTWYNSPSYRQILGHRLTSADNRAFLVEGL